MKWIISACLFVITIPVTVLGSALHVPSCGRGRLSRENNDTSLISLDDAITIKLKPLNIINERLLLNIILENRYGQELYVLELDTDMEAHTGSVEVTMKEVPTRKDVLKISWPPILLPHAWTSLHFRLHFQQLLQFAVIPRELLQYSPNSPPTQILLTPLAVSIRLVKYGVTALRLKLGSDISLEYRINCESEYLAPLFASNFGLESSVPFWSSLTWILLGVVVLLGVTLAFMGFNWWRNNQNHYNQSPKSFEMKQMKESQQREGSKPKVATGGQRKPSASDAPDSKNTLGCLNVTLGTVSSRAPSPGGDLDENTFDYINKAFTTEKE